jgi:hypothetical protein
MSQQKMSLRRLSKRYSPDAIAVAARGNIVLKPIADPGRYAFAHSNHIAFLTRK